VRLVPEKVQVRLGPPRTFLKNLGGEPSRPSRERIYACMYAYVLVDYVVRVISISDEVYLELSRMKNGKSFTQLLKSMIDRCENKGDPKAILEYLNSHEALSDEDAEEMLAEIEKGRKRTMPRKIDLG